MFKRMKISSQFPRPIIRRTMWQKGPKRTWEPWSGELFYSECLKISSFSSKQVMEGFQRQVPLMFCKLRITSMMTQVQIPKLSSRSHFRSFSIASPVWLHTWALLSTPELNTVERRLQTIHIIVPLQFPLYSPRLRIQVSLFLSVEGLTAGSRWSFSLQ